MSNHKIQVGMYNGQLGCNPDALHVKEKDKVTWATDTDLEQWAVVFGPEAPFSEQVVTSKTPTTTVTAHRRCDSHRHKYVVLAFDGGEVKVGDPDLIVDE